MDRFRSGKISFVAVSVGFIVFINSAFAQSFYFSKSLSRGVSGPEVVGLQEALKGLPGVYPERLVTGYFGSLTEKAVKKFQEQNGIETIGVVGPKTRAALNRLPQPAAPESFRLGPPPRELPGCTTINQGSFFGCYYHELDFSKLALTRTDPRINFNWFNSSPDPSMLGDNFSARWQGKFGFEEAVYNFTITTDDGMRLYIDGELVLDKWFDQSETTHFVVRRMTAGVHTIVVDYYEHTLQAVARLFWAKDKPPYMSYSWRATSTLTGEVRLPTPVPRPVVILDGKPTITLDTSAAVRLAQVHKIVLADDEIKWDDFTTGMLYEMVRRLPDTRYKFGDNKPWRVTLTSASLTDDVEIKPYRDDDPVRYAKISRAAFVRSNPTLQPGPNGASERVLYSNRLLRAVLKTFFNERYLLEDILKDRYGVAVGFAEPRDEFQDFNLGELQYLISVFEDMPAGFRSIPGFEKVVRRRNGLTNPDLPGAPAIAWVDAGYVEFMDFAFTSGSAEYIRRLVAHEIAHFLWHKVLTEETQKQFMALSGWSRARVVDLIQASAAAVKDHPKAQDKREKEIWFRKTTTNFVSDYSAGVNPDEDFAETIAYYVYQPDLVRNIAPDKYNFVKNIVNGYEYVVLVDAKYTFQVFNLEPDVTFPGKIVGVDIEVKKLANGDNYVVATLHLSPKLGDGAEQAYGRIVSPAGTYLDVGFNPVDGDKYKLRSTFTINKFSSSGWWAPTQITVQDKVDNRRYEPQNQFGWLMFIDNSDEDLDPPVANTALVTDELTFINGEPTVRVYIPVTDRNEDAGVGGYATLQQDASNQSTYNYADYDGSRKRLIFTFTIRKYNASGIWRFREFSVFDMAGNWGRYDLKEKERLFDITTPSPDRAKPEIDLSAIKIQATPRNPARPNGETDVSIWYAARDDNSGLGWVTYILQKPTGGILFDYHYHENFYTPYFVGDPREFKTYRIDLVLPAGSPPGTWILQEIVLHDKAGNKLTNNFVELGVLRPFEVK